MMRALRVRRRTLLTASTAIVLLSAVSTVSVAAATGGLTRNGVAPASATCDVPSLPGTVVTVTLADMRSHMGNRSMMGGAGSMMSQDDWPQFRHGMMTVRAAPSTAAAGTVSLRVDNTGYLTHELIVLPLADGQQRGERTPGRDGKVIETQSVGEASATCTAGTGEGIAAGSAGWVTLTLAAGRYELLCNLPGHYSGGMYTEVDLR